LIDEFGKQRKNRLGALFVETGIVFFQANTVIENLVLSLCSLLCLKQSMMSLKQRVAEWFFIWV